MKRIFLDTNVLIDYIVTNDRRHYDFSDIPHFTSEAFVEQLDLLL